MYNGIVLLGQCPRGRTSGDGGSDTTQLFLIGTRQSLPLQFGLELPAPALMDQPVDDTDGKEHARSDLHATPGADKAEWLPVFVHTAYVNLKT